MEIQYPNHIQDQDQLYDPAHNLQGFNLEGHQVKHYLREKINWTTVGPCTDMTVDQKEY